MNFGEHIIDLRTKVDDLKSVRFTDAQLAVCLNNAYKNVYRELVNAGQYTSKKAVTVTIPADAQEVDLPVETLKVIHAQDSEGRRYDILQEEASREGNTPTVYTSRQGFTKSLGYYRKVGSALTLDLIYIETITVFEPTPDPGEILFDIPVEHHDVVGLYAAILLLGLDKTDTTAFWVGVYNDARAGMLESVDMGNTNQSVVADVTSGDHHHASRQGT